MSGAVVPPVASISSSVSSFVDGIGQFFSDLSKIQLPALGLALLCFGIYLTLRSRAYFHVLRAAYPTEAIQWRRIWGAYVAAYGFNNVIPARGGDVIKLFLVRTSVPRSTYSTVGSSIFVELVFDLTIAIPVLGYAFTQGVFPKPPDFASLNAFDLSFLASNLRLTLFLVTVLGVLAVVGFALLSARVRAFWTRVRQGIVILRDRPKYLREVWLVQFAGWCFRVAAFWLLLDAFNVGGSFGNAVLVLGVNAIAALLPFTPGGAGVQQALLLKVFAGQASGATIAAYAVGQQIAIAAFSLALGFAALFFVFRFRSFREVLAAGKASREAERSGSVAV